MRIRRFTMMVVLSLLVAGAGGTMLIVEGLDAPAAVAKKNDKGDNGKHEGEHKKKGKQDEDVPVEPRGTSVAVPPVSPTPDNASGVVLVASARCDVGTPTAGMTWNDRCVEPDRGASFRLGVEDGLFAGWYTDRDVDETGTARFESVPAGRYSLEELGRNWCHAESDSVDANGDVIVRSGETVQVWIYNCVGGS